MAAAAADRVVFMGDSITGRWADTPSFKGQRNFVGRGIPGQTAAQMLVRFRSDVISLKPAVVQIMAGTNDVAQNTGPETEEDIFGYIASMVELAQAHNITVVLASIPPAKAFPWHQGLEPVPQIRRLNSLLKSYAAERGISYIDYWGLLATTDGALKEEYSSDGVHPSSAGYEAMWPLANEAIGRALMQKMGDGSDGGK